MNEYKMTDEERKMLTEKLLGECWHEWGLIGSGNYKCKYCGYISFRDFFPSNRTFTTYTDMLAVFREIRDKGKLRDFINYVCSRVEATIPRQPVYFMQWLFLDNPERACCLAADFWEEQGT
jgi:hypothetical protein